MRLIALLSWYDEPAWCLTELIASLARAQVDHVVAVDGAYVLYPGGRPRSRSEEAQTLVAAAQGTGMGLSLHCPQDVWMGNEVEKRSFMFAAGHLIATPGEDWLWVCDGDEVVTESIGLREALERSDFDVGEVMLDQITKDGPQGQLAIRKLFRAQATGITVEGNHFTYVTGDGRLLWQGHYTSPFLVDAEPLPFVRVDHRQMNRSADRIARRDRWYALREEQKVETSVA